MVIRLPIRCQPELVAFAVRQRGAEDAGGEAGARGRGIAHFRHAQPAVVAQPVGAVVRRLSTLMAPLRSSDILRRSSARTPTPSSSGAVRVMPATALVGVNSPRSRNDVRAQRSTPVARELVVTLGLRAQALERQAPVGIDRSAFDVVRGDRRAVVAILIAHLPGDRELGHRPRREADLHQRRCQPSAEVRASNRSAGQAHAREVVVLRRA